MATENRLDIIRASEALAARLRGGLEVRIDEPAPGLKPLTYRDEAVGWSLHRDAHNYILVVALLTPATRHPNVIAVLDVVARHTAYVLGANVDPKSRRLSETIVYLWPVAGSAGYRGDATGEAPTSGGLGRAITE